MFVDWEMNVLFAFVKLAVVTIPGEWRAVMRKIVMNGS